MNLKNKILFTAIFPTFILGVIVLILTTTVVRSSMIDEIEDGLKSAATATNAAYNVYNGEFIQSPTGDVWKGSFNVSTSTMVVDRIKENSRMDVVVFYGGNSVMTSIIDEAGNRIAVTMDEATMERVITNNENKEGLFEKDIILNNQKYYGYYSPLLNLRRQPVGAVLIVTPKRVSDAAVSKIVFLIVGIVVVVMILCSALSMFVANSVTGALKRGIHAVEQVASGDLNVNVSLGLLKSKDELGDLARAIEKLKSELAKSIQGIVSNAQSVVFSADDLRGTAEKTQGILSEMEHSINQISESATEQASMSKQTSDNVSEMSERIEQTTREVNLLRNNAGEMEKASAQTTATIQELLNCNDEVHNLTDAIKAQIDKTHRSAMQIQEVTSIIASIAEETDLLSLNASIEAARAGESGRGFAVVAGQIQQLANQSNLSSQRIDQIIYQLIEDSQEAVEIMAKVTETVEKQTKSMNVTKAMNQEMMQRTQASIDSMREIGESMERLDSARKDIEGIVAKLSNIAIQNASITQEVCATTTTVSNSFTSVEQSMSGLKTIAGELDANVKHFKSDDMNK